jgi:1,4-alpha-glucan branching enzyme
MKRLYIQLRAALCMALVVFAVSCGPRAPEIGAQEYASAGPREVEGGVRFICYAPKAHRVVIVGDFNNWSTGADPMYDREEKGAWAITLPLQPGRYEYKFLIDGEKWIADPANPRKVKDGFGAFNSVVEVKR